MELPTRSLVLRVCQFRHDRINEDYYNATKFFCQLIFINVYKLFQKNLFFLFLGAVLMNNSPPPYAQYL